MKYAKKFREADHEGKAPSRAGHNNLSTSLKTETKNADEKSISTSNEVEVDDISQGKALGAGPQTPVDLTSYSSRNLKVLNSTKDKNDKLLREKALENNEIAVDHPKETP